MTIDASHYLHQATCQFGIIYPNNLHGVGSPDDILTFFRAISLTTDDPESDYPYTILLRQRPVFGNDMLALFDEAIALREAMRAIPVSPQTLSYLNLRDRTTKLKTDAADLAGMFERIFIPLAEKAPEFVRLLMKREYSSVLETGSVRIGPIEPLVPSRRFKKLPASAFDDEDPPLWLREEIFDPAYYIGKI